MVFFHGLCLGDKSVNLLRKSGSVLAEDDVEVDIDDGSDAKAGTELALTGAGFGLVLTGSGCVVIGAEGVVTGFGLLEELETGTGLGLDFGAGGGAFKNRKLCCIITFC